MPVTKQDLIGGSKQVFRQVLRSRQNLLRHAVLHLDAIHLQRSVVIEYQAIESQNAAHRESVAAVEHLRAAVRVGHMDIEIKPLECPHHRHPAADRLSQV